MTDDKQLATIEQANNLAPLSVQDVTNQVRLIQEIMRATMREGEHYGVIPGCGNKPALFQPGAQKLILTFRMNPDYEIEVITMPRDHREYRVKCILTNTSGVFIGAGVGSCSTMESKYRWRKGERVCPACGKASIIKGRAEYGGGWLCFAKKGGCGEKYADNDPAITGQETGRAENTDIADVYNTCLKIAKKRALVDATLTRTAASDIFTQDIEDNAEEAPQSARPANWEHPPTEPARINKEQRDHMMGLFKTQALKTRDKYIPYVNEVLKSHDWKTITSTTDLTGEQAAAVIAALEQDQIPDDQGGAI